jgi:hypothetical protein
MQNPNPKSTGEDGKQSNGVIGSLKNNWRLFVNNIVNLKTIDFVKVFLK